MWVEIVNPPGEPPAFYNQDDDQFTLSEKDNRLMNLIQDLYEMRDQAICIDERTLAFLIEVAALEASERRNVGRVMMEYMGAEA